MQLSLQMIIFLFAVMLVFSLPACSSSSDHSENRIESIQVDPENARNADIIRNPITANGPIDTTNLPKITFEETTFDFGTINEGEVVEHAFAFTNTGAIPLLISSTRSTCGCTVPEHPEEPIPPGEGGVIKVRFNSKGKSRQINKPVTIIANTFPKNNTIRITGYVNPSK